jgi:four helix bundle suffix protein
VARASLDELLLDYEDFLRQRGLKQWGKDDPEARAVRAVGARQDPTDRSDRADPSDHWRAYARWLDHPDPAVVANAVICLIHQANYLLDQQIAALEREFVQRGGYTEQLAAARLVERGRWRGSDDQTDRSDPSDQSDREKKTPACPICGKPMVLRTARQGKQRGSQFWGCSDYPECRGAREFERSDGSVGSDRSVESHRKR